jgi:hypothetical protein
VLTCILSVSEKTPLLKRNSFFLIGIITFTNSSSAIQRWCVTHFIRTQVASNMLNDLGFHRKEDIAKAHPSRIRKDIKQLKELTDFLIS